MSKGKSRILEAIAVGIEALKEKPSGAPGSETRTYQLGYNKGLSDAATYVRGLDE